MPLKKIIETEDGVRLEAFKNENGFIVVNIDEYDNPYNSGYITLTYKDVSDLIEVLKEVQAQ